MWRAKWPIEITQSPQVDDPSSSASCTPVSLGHLPRAMLGRVFASEGMAG